MKGCEERTSDILEEDRRAGLSHGADHGDEGLAGVPVGAGDSRVLGEVDGLQGEEAPLLDGLDGLVDPLLPQSTSAAV